MYIVLIIVVISTFAFICGVITAIKNYKDE